jgi:hypothetical protein
MPPHPMGDCMTHPVFLRRIPRADAPPGSASYALEVNLLFGSSVFIYCSYNVVNLISLLSCSFEI